MQSGGDFMWVIRLYKVEASCCYRVNTALTAEQRRAVNLEQISVTTATAIKLHDSIQLVDFGAQLETGESRFTVRKRSLRQQKW